MVPSSPDPCLQCWESDRYPPVEVAVSRTEADSHLLDAGPAGETPAGWEAIQLGVLLRNLLTWGQTGDLSVEIAK